MAFDSASASMAIGGAHIDGVVERSPDEVFQLF